MCVQFYIYQKSYNQHMDCYYVRWILNSSAADAAINIATDDERIDCPHSFSNMKFIVVHVSAICLKINKFTHSDWFPPHWIPISVLYVCVNAIFGFFFFQQSLIETLCSEWITHAMMVFRPQHQHQSWKFYRSKFLILIFDKVSGEN